ncbi:ThiF family adenylyltransferase [Subtercola endophyticus]|uniref:ThiF family adenylyltransferase n=1 Tax=Subtercola endophyticus TaxID=2895559 RepID=UPI001E5E0BB6|nr:ThiF family adenylyltransferase [Subtercola endophyticus]UFS61010.1 ThiF family adenylyltransferase [Subtercola endophyticus]
MARTPLVAPGRELTASELERYSRQIRLPQIGIEGQRRLANSRVVVLGAGGLGSPVLTSLAAAGVGTIGIVDEDVVDVSNLQRQTIHTTAAVGTSKVHSAAAGIRRLNPHVNVELHDERLTGRNAARILSAYDLVIDGTDNFATRYLANDTAALLGMPYVWGSVLRFDGQASTFWSAAGAHGELGPNLRDVFPVPPGDDEVESCAVAGVLGPLCATVGATMASEALKLIAGFGELLLGRILVVDALDGSYTNVPFHRAAADDSTPPADAVKGSASGPASASASTSASASGSGSGSGSAQGSPIERSTMPDESTPATPAAPSITATELAARLVARAAGTDDFVLVDVREPWERELVAIEGSALVPLQSILSEAAQEVMPRDETVIVHCHYDNRSRYAREVLLQSGWTNVTFVEGGIDAWATEVDPTLPRY